MLISRRIFCAAGLASPVILGGCDDNKAVGKVRGESGAPADLTSEQLSFSEGSQDAPVVMQEFLSLTCSHCARFHKEGYPLLKERFLDKGLVLLVYRDFPLDGMALRAAMLVRALPPARGVKLQSVLLEQQGYWINRESDFAPLKRLAHVAGLSPEAIEEILSDEAKMDAIIESRQQALETYGIDATPSFVIGHDRFSGGDFDNIPDWVSGYLA